MLLVSRLSHIRKIVPSCYFGRLKKSSSGKGWYVSSRILRDKNANDIGFCGSIYDKDYGYLKWWTVCIFWIKSFRGEDCDIGADIYISFSTMKLFYLFTGRIVILEILDAPYVLLRLTANIVNFEYLSMVKTVTRCVLLHIFRKLIAKLWFDTQRRCVSLKVKIVNDIGYFSSNRNCDITNDIMDSVSKWNVYIERWNSRFKSLKVHGRR